MKLIENMEKKKNKLDDTDLEEVTGGVGEEQGPNDETDGPSLIPAGASFEKWPNQ